jgi:hypothetical protein
MKKFLLTALLILGPATASADYAIVDNIFCNFEEPGIPGICVDVLHNSYPNYSYPYVDVYNSIDGTQDGPGQGWSEGTPLDNGNFWGGQRYIDAITFKNALGGNSAVDSNYQFFFNDVYQDYCNGLPIADCAALLTPPQYSFCINIDENYNITETACLYPQEVPQTSGVSSLVSTAAAGYTATVGSSMGSDVSFVGDSFIKIIIGSALAVLLALRYWIVALIIIAAVVYFSFKAFRFFKH